MNQQLKVSSFYGAGVPRPHLLLDNQGKPVEDRLNAPKVNDALLQWAKQVPFKMGGALVKPTWDGEAPPTAKTDFQLFLEERSAEILADNPHLTTDHDRQAFMSAASGFWKSKLTESERVEYRKRSLEERQAVKARIAELEETNPEFKEYRAKSINYKRSIANVNSAARAATDPLWRAQRRLQKAKNADTTAPRALTADGKKKTLPKGGKKTKRYHKGLSNKITRRPVYKKSTLGAIGGLEKKRSNKYKQLAQGAAMRATRSQKPAELVSLPAVATAKKGVSKKSPEKKVEAPAATASKGRKRRK